MPVARTRARSLSPVGSIASQISISTTQQIGRRSLTSTQSDHPSQIPDRPSPSRDGSIEKKPEEAPIRLKGSLKAPRPTIEPYTLHIPIAEGPQRKSITWSRSSRCYLYPSGRRRSSLTKRLMRHKTCPFLLICCLLPTVLIGALFFVLLPFGRADDTDDNKFDYYMHCERSNFIHLVGRSIVHREAWRNRFRMRWVFGRRRVSCCVYGVVGHISGKGDFSES